MALRYLQFNLDRANTFVSFFTNLGENKFTFTIRWNEYCNCFFMDIQDIDANYLISGLAIVNNLTIRHPNLPYVMLFTHIQNETYEPTIDNINEFGLVYDDGEVV